MNLTQLSQKAQTADKVKLFDTFNGQSAKFFNGKVETVELSTETYEAFVSHLRAEGWDLAPQVTSGGFVAKPPKNVIGQNALPRFTCNGRSIEETLG